MTTLGILAALFLLVFVAILCFAFYVGGGGAVSHKAYRFGRLILTTCLQSAAPVFDRCWATDREGNRYEGVAVLLTPWRRDSYGERPLMRAIVLGWRR